MRELKRSLVRGSYWILFGAGLLSCQAADAIPSPTGNEDLSNPRNSAATQTLPPLVLRADTANVLLTWLTEEGDFRVSESIDSIPTERRNPVRVVRTDQGSGTGATVYVANLTALTSEGSYPVKTMARSDWNALGAGKRTKRMEAFAPAARPVPSPGHDSNTPKELGAPLAATIYGADWCKPCHQAEAYLKTLGVHVTKKNIEKSRAAQAEMREKLARIGRNGAGIPVIDLMGQLFVGYSKASLKQAVDAARKRGSSTG